MEKLSFILGLIGSIGTAYTVLMTLYWNRIDIDFYISDSSISAESVILYMVFTNKSRLPISITDVRIWNKGIPYSCLKEPVTVRVNTSRTKGTVMYKEPIKSVPFPINLPCLSGTSCYLYFQIPQGNFQCVSNSLTVELSTNRFRKLQKTLSVQKN